MYLISLGLLHGKLALSLLSTGRYAKRPWEMMGFYINVFFYFVALYLAYYETALKWKVYRLGRKEDLGMSFHITALRLCDFEGPTYLLCV